MLVELRMIVYIVLKDDELMAIIYIYIPAVTKGCLMEVKGAHCPLT